MGAPRWHSWRGEIGIVGVPSLLAIGAGYYITGSVDYRLKLLERYSLTEQHTMNSFAGDAKLRWDAVRRALLIVGQIQLQQCIHDAHDDKERADCLRAITGPLPDGQPK